MAPLVASKAGELVPLIILRQRIGDKSKATDDKAKWQLWVESGH